MADFKDIGISRTYAVDLKTAYRADNANYFCFRLRLRQPLNPKQHSELMMLLDQIEDICKPNITEVMPLHAPADRVPVVDMNA